MTLQEIWFVVIGVLFTGYFVLEGFDFGVGMLMPALGAGDDARRRAVLNTIGPVWDGNEVWLITAAGALFAAFPEWYASMFSGFYLPLLVVLVALILRVCAIEYRGKIDDPHWRRVCDFGIGIGSWIPAFLWGLVFADLVHGVALDGRKQVRGSIFDLFGPYALLGGLATTGLFALHGAVFLSLKTAGELRADAVRTVRWLIAPVAVVVLGFAIWTQMAYGKDWTWSAVGAVAVALAAAVIAGRFGRDGWTFLATAVGVVAVSVLLFGSLFPQVLPSTIDHAFDLTVYNASSTPYTLKVLSWSALVAAPVVLIYQGWTYWVFRQRIAIEHIPPGIGLSMKS